MSDRLKIESVLDAAKLLHNGYENEFADVLGSISAWVSGIADVNCDGVEPLFNPLQDLQISNVREDIIDFTPIEMIGNSNNFFTVPKIVRK